MSSIQTVVFDLGGVVVSWDPVAVAASVFHDTAERELVLSGLFTDHDWVDLDRGTLSVDDAVARTQRRTGLDPARLRAVLDAVPASLVPDPSSLNLIADVQRAGKRLLALSNLHRASLAHLDDVYDLFSHFDGRVVSCEVGSCKPEAEIYRELMGRFTLDPRATAFIDDSQPNLDAAARFGIRTIRFTSVESCRAQLRELGCL